MAKKYLTSFDSRDVLKVVLRCVSCEGELSFAVSRNLDVPKRCPVCSEEWNDQAALEYRKETTWLMNVLRLFSAKSKPNREESKKVPWTVRLVIEGGSDSTGEDVQDAP